MSSAPSSLDEAALALPAAARLALAEKLLVSALAEMTPAHEAVWDAEVRRRRQEYLDEKVVLVPLDEVERSTARLLE